LKIIAPNKHESADREQKHELKDFELAVIAEARQKTTVAALHSNCICTYCHFLLVDLFIE
jgi:hypothetical protein